MPEEIKEKEIGGKKKAKKAAPPLRGMLDYENGERRLVSFDSTNGAPTWLRFEGKVFEFKDWESKRIAVYMERKSLPIVQDAWVEVK
jgi:hypothetical protein